MERTFEGGLKLKQFREYVLLGDHTFLPTRVTLPDSSFHGHVSPLVCTGENVCVGQIIAETSDGIPVYSSVSGLVDSISDEGHCGATIVIISDDQFLPDPSAEPVRGKLSELPPESIRDLIRRSAVTGSCSGRSLHDRMVELGYHCSRLVVNICDSSPYTAVNRYFATEKAKEISGGARILFRAMGANDCWFALGDESKESAVEFRRYSGRSGRFSVSIMANKYPQGHERLLQTEFSDPASGLNATDILVVSAEECSAVYDYFSKGMPMTEKVVTVDGDCLAAPQTLKVPLGSIISEVIRFCEPRVAPGLVIIGDLMTGHAQSGEDSLVGTKTDTLLAFRYDFGKGSNRPASCVNCGRCISVCPVGLWPNRIIRLTEEGRPEQAVRYLTSLCLRCGLCTYVCPSGEEPAAAVAHAEEWWLSEKRKHAADQSVEGTVAPLEEALPGGDASDKDHAETVSEPENMSVISSEEVVCPEETFVETKKDDSADAAPTNEAAVFESCMGCTQNVDDAQPPLKEESTEVKNDGAVE